MGKLRHISAAALSALLAACNLGDSPKVAPPRLQSGPEGTHPAVVDLRWSSSCKGGIVSFTMRFSRSMDTANIENSLGIDEVLGDVQGSVLPVRERAVEIPFDSFRWEENDRTVTFEADLLPNRQYVITLPATAADTAGAGLDGQVGADVDRDGENDIFFDDEQYARADDDYLAAPSAFQSLPIVRPILDLYQVCRALDAPSAWLTGRNQSRPRVIDIIGVLPTAEVVPHYVESGRRYTIGVTDGVVAVSQPLPARGALRLRIGAPNTSPTRPFPQRFNDAPALPSTVVNNLEVSDENLKSYKARAFLDDRLLVPAPLVGTAASATENGMTADELAEVPKNALAGAYLVFRGRNDYVYSVPITGNEGPALWVESIYFNDFEVTRDDPFKPLVLTFRSGAFRENELKGLRLFRPIINDQLVAEGNTANKVRVRAGTGDSSCAFNVALCNYEIHVNLEAMSLKGKAFEIVPRFLYVQTEEERPDGVVFTVRLNAGESPILDIYGRPFVDGKADGNDLRDEADDQWNGFFTSGDYEDKPIPPTLQLNDGRYYSPFALGPTLGATVDAGAAGRFTHLGHGLLGRTETVCRNGGPERRLEAIGMMFATPDGEAQDYGVNDLLLADSISPTNFSLYRLDGLALTPLGVAVTGTTVQTAFYAGGTFLGRWPASLVMVAPARTGALVRLAGLDGACGTADDRWLNDYRPWQGGDRIVIAHRLHYPGGANISLDGNYDGLLSDGARDDMIFEYRPDQAERFARIPSE